jgi:hypothetical protein
LCRWFGEQTDDLRLLPIEHFLHVVIGAAGTERLG